jgi:hypothetical protein
MGNKASAEDEQKLKSKTSAELMDYLASHYITTSSFQALKKLNEKEYCDKMVVLTTNILNKYFDTVDIGYLEERVQNGYSANSANNESNKETADKAYFMPKDELHDRLDTAENKQAVCRGIAKFYVTIAHLFAAIMTTTNPMVQYTDPESGETNQVSVLEKADAVPDSIAYEIIHKTSLCDRRIQSLKRGHGAISADPNKETVNVHPQVCDMNKNKETGESMRLTDEPGIPEFIKLYFDKYNVETGEFDDMTDKTKKIFEEDLQIFYEVFTGNTTLPNSVTKFSDIKLRDYHDQPHCQGPESTWNKHVRGTTSQKLFKQYADLLNEMISNANKNQEALMDILTQLFGYTVDPNTGKKTVKINPEITEQKLQELVVQCRERIIKLTLQCEIDFTNGVKIYEAIIDSKVFETVQKQIDNIDENILAANVPVPELELAVPVPVPELEAAVPVPAPLLEEPVPAVPTVPTKEVIPVPTIPVPDNVPTTEEVILPVVPTVLVPTEEVILQPMPVPQPIQEVVQVEPQPQQL